MSADLKNMLLLFLFLKTYSILHYIKYRPFRKLGAVREVDRKAAAERVS
jgi:hypothetical protein